MHSSYVFVELKYDTLKRVAMVVSKSLRELLDQQRVWCGHCTMVILDAQDLHVMGICFTAAMSGYRLR